MTLQVRLWTFPYTNNTFQLHKTRCIKFDGRIYTWHCAGIEYNAETCSSYTDYIFIEIRQVNLTFMTDVYVPSECCLLPWSKQFFFTFIIRSAIFSFYSAFWKTFLNNEWIKFYLIVILRRLYNAYCSFTKQSIKTILHHFINHDITFSSEIGRHKVTQHKSNTACINKQGCIWYTQYYVFILF